jgi:hypothetical protein
VNGCHARSQTAIVTGHFHSNDVSARSISAAWAAPLSQSEDVFQAHAELLPDSQIPSTANRDLKSRAISAGDNLTANGLSLLTNVAAASDEQKQEVTGGRSREEATDGQEQGSRARPFHIQVAARRVADSGTAEATGALSSYGVGHVQPRAFQCGIAAFQSPALPSPPPKQCGHQPRQEQVRIARAGAPTSLAAVLLVWLEAQDRRPDISIRDPENRPSRWQIRSRTGDSVSAFELLRSNIVLCQHFSPDTERHAPRSDAGSDGC